MPARGSAKPVFTLTVTLQDAEPVIWRRLLAPGTIRLNKLSDVLQAAMGWTNSHFHAFEIGDLRYHTEYDDDPPEGEIDDSTITVADAIGAARRFEYEYDFGDMWVHEITVDGVSEVPGGLKFAVCLDGEQACPPEDVGGTDGYADFLAVIGDPSHDQHDFMLEWAGGSFDPGAFDLGATNAALQRLR